MLKALTFVKGAIAVKDFAPILTHFGIANGRIIGYNGTLALSSPIQLDLVANPKAIPFINAIESCSESIQIVQLPKGNLSISSGKFKVTIECDLDPYPSIPIGGDSISLQGPILPALKKLAPFISEDASRSWSRGVLLRGQSAFATNNTCIVQYWLGQNWGTDLCIPADAVREMIRIGKEPIALEITDNSLTVRYSDDQWLFTSAITGVWPNVEDILDKNCRSTSKIPDTFFNALQRIKPFLAKEKTCYLRDGKITTNLCDDEGAECEIPNLKATGKYVWKLLTLMEPIAETADFGQIPICFLGDRLRGLISGWSNEN